MVEPEDRGSFPDDGGAHDALPMPSMLTASGVIFTGLGVVLLVLYLAGGLRSPLLPTGWVFPVVLIATGTLMALRRRFDIVATLWGGLALAVFLLDVLVFMNALDRGLDDPAAFDAAIIVAALGLVPLVLRRRFRD